MQDGFCRIGISGGTFDPVHNGHLVVAAEVKKKLNLDKVIFVPAGNPPHKKEMNVTGAEHRYNMLFGAIGTDKSFEVSRVEIDRIGFTFTIDTLKELKKKYGNDSELFFITGADVIHDLLTWKDFEKVFSMCEFVAVLRPGFEKAEFINDINNLHNKYNAKINIMEVPQIDISSTMIREKVSKNQSIDKFVPEIVENYIKANNLYKY